MSIATAKTLRTQFCSLSVIHPYAQLWCRCDLSLLVPLKQKLEVAEGYKFHSLPWNQGRSGGREEFASRNPIRLLAIH
jgi:hypothetical protein